MNSPHTAKSNVHRPDGVDRKAANRSPEELVEEDRATHHPATYPLAHTKLDEGWAEMLHAIRGIRKLQLQAPPLHPVSREGKLPLSFAQQRLWYLSRLEPGSPVYNTARAYRVMGPLNVIALAHSLAEIVRRHEILRTAFPTVAGQPVQAIAPPPPSWQVRDESSMLQAVDLQDLPAAEREAGALQLVTEEVQRPFDLAQGPLLRVTLLRLGQEEYILLLVTHQMLFDGQAWGEFNREVSLLYEAFSALEALSQQEGVTLFATLLAAFQTLLHLYSAQDDILVFSSALGRSRFQIRKLIGLFTNLLPLRIDFSGNPSFRMLLGRVRKVALGAYAHQDLPFEQLVEVLQLERGLDHASPFQVMFIFQNAPSPPLQLAGLTLAPVQVGPGMTKFDLSLSMANREEGLAGTLTYKTDLFESATIVRMLKHFRTMLERIVVDPGQRISDLPCLTEVERQQLLPRRGGVQADCPSGGGCVLSTSDRTRSTVRPTFVAPRDTWEQQLTGTLLLSAGESRQCLHRSRGSGQAARPGSIRLWTPRWCTEPRPG